ncbi:tryptophan biosynthesis modulator TrpM [Actinacidiphila bryophytorum]|uniref:tryptophan biosynthesis modulator TrpM n=1 Tax=Actinacidiphila bryophytorum TaxID=1436133 RepID=UPI003556F11B
MGAGRAVPRAPVCSAPPKRRPWWLTPLRKGKAVAGRPGRQDWGTRGGRVRGVSLEARLAPGCRPRGCRAPARRVLGRRVRYVIGCEPGQVNGRRWRRG